MRVLSVCTHHAAPTHHVVVTCWSRSFSPRLAHVVFVVRRVVPNPTVSRDESEETLSPPPGGVVTVAPHTAAAGGAYLRQTTEPNLKLKLPPFNQ